LRSPEGDTIVIETTNYSGEISERSIVAGASRRTTNRLSVGRLRLRWHHGWQPHVHQQHERPIVAAWDGWWAANLRDPHEGRGEPVTCKQTRWAEVDVVGGDPRAQTSKRPSSVGDDLLSPILCCWSQPTRDRSLRARTS